MVATRRNPVVPAQSANPRTNSTQAVQKGSKQARNVSQNGLSQDVELSQPNQPGAKQKGNKRKKSKKSKSVMKKFIDLLTRVFVFFVIVYTMRVCPNDDALETPLCRALFMYRKHFLEPVLLPPFQALYYHPTVQPYVQTVQPHIENAMRVTTPIITRTTKEINSRVLPQWNKRVLPLVHRHVTPQLRRLDPAVTYYNTQLLRIERAYNLQLAPRVAFISTHAQTAATASKPYVALAGDKSYQAFQASKPHVLNFLSWLKVQLDHAFVLLGHWRRLYVDPHLLKIWEKVTELSSGSTSSSTSLNKTNILQNTSSSHASGHSIESFSAPSHLQEEVTPEASVTPEEAEQHASSTTPDIPIPPPTEEAALSIESIIAESLHGASQSSSTKATEVPSSTEQVEPTSMIADDPITGLNDGNDQPPFEPATSLIAESLHNAPVAESLSSSQVFETAPPVASPIVMAEEPETPDDPSEEEEDPLAALYAQLGLAPEPAPAPTDSSASTEETPVEDNETEEEKENRRVAAATALAAKRAAIEAKHTEWEVKLHDLIASYKNEAGGRLIAIRQAGGKQIMADPKINDMVDDLEKAGNKYLKGIEGYLSELNKGIDKKAKLGSDKRRIWDAVVTKVEEKFNEELKTLRSTVHDMYVNVVNEELELIRDWATEVKSVAEQGQMAVGLDYVWLDDVTARDWTRYHDLIKTYEAFAQDIQAIQAGSHELSPSSNPLVDILDDLDADVQDIVLGFESGLRRLRRVGDKELNPDTKPEKGRKGSTTPAAPVEEKHQSLASPAPNGAAVEPEVSILPIDSSPSVEATPEVSILPISPGDKPPALDNEGTQEPLFLDDLPGIAFIGRGSEEVMERLKGVTVEGSETEAQSKPTTGSVSSNDHVEL
jgi:hypothetical protein